jgi:tetratricopeptide (TPR) repeat protein
MPVRRATILLVLMVGMVRGSFAQTPQSGDFADLERRAEEARKSNHSEEAVALYQAGLALQPSWDEGWWYLGTGLYELRRYSEARTAFQRLAALTPQNGSAWALLGLCEFQLADYPSSLKNLTKSEQLGIADNPEMASVVHYHAAILLNREGNFDRARDQLQPFESEGNNSPQILDAIGINALRLQLLPSEIPTEKRALITKAGQAAWRPYNAGHPERAEQLFQELVAAYPNTPHLHDAYGSYLLGSDPEKALAEFAQELKVDPADVLARTQMVYLYLKQGAPEKGLPLAREAVRLQPESVMAHNAFGRVLLATGQAGAGIEQLQAAVRLAPEIPESHFTLAEAYRTSGKSAEAAKEMAEFERLKKQAPGTPASQ